MEKILRKNLLILVASVVLVLTFMYVFSLIYEKVRIKPSCELKDYKVKVEIQNKDGSKFKPDSCQYIIKPEPHYTENPIEANDYSSFLVSFISVLATFVVIANFANAKDLISSAENAENAKIEAENAKIAAETAKTDSETIKTQVAGQITEVNNILTDIKGLKAEVEQTKNKADDSLIKASQMIAEQKEAIEAQFNKLNCEVNDAQILFANHKAEIDAKQDDIIKLYNDVKRQIEQFEKEVSCQRAELIAAATKIAAVENQVADLKNNVMLDNTLSEHKQLDSDSSNRTLPINISINNDNKEV